MPSCFAMRYRCPEVGTRIESACPIGALRATDRPAFHGRKSPGDPPVEPAMGMTACRCLGCFVQPTHMNQAPCRDVADGVAGPARAWVRTGASDSSERSSAICVAMAWSASLTGWSAISRKMCSVRCSPNKRRAVCNGCNGGLTRDRDRSTPLARSPTCDRRRSVHASRQISNRDGFRADEGPRPGWGCRSMADGVPARHQEEGHED